MARMSRSKSYYNSHKNAGKGVGSAVKNSRSVKSTGNIQKSSNGYGKSAQKS